MYKKNKILAIIPARAGSKRLKNKNKLDFHGKPLVQWSIDVAKESKYIDAICVTTNDIDILKIARNNRNVYPLKRNKNLSKDDTLIIDVIKDVYDKIVGYDYFALLQPTSPLRTVKDVDDSIKKYFQSDSWSVVTVCKTKKLFHVLLDDRKKIEKTITTDQYNLNGAVYVMSFNDYFKHKNFVTNNTRCHVMSINRSVDIDTIEEFKTAEAFYAMG